MKKLALVGLAGALAAVGIAVPSIAGGNKYADQTTPFVCKDSAGTQVGTVTLVGPLKLWPPNHKMVDEPVTAQATNADGSPKSGTVQLTISPDPVGDVSGGDGGSQHDPDVAFTDSSGDTFTATESDGNVVAGMQLRAERSGKGDGRTYTISWSASFNGTSCSSSDGNDQHAPFVITVPHDMGGGADWK